VGGSARSHLRAGADHRWGRGAVQPSIETYAATSNTVTPPSKITKVLASGEPRRKVAPATGNASFAAIVNSHSPRS